MPGDNDRVLGTQIGALSKVKMLAQDVPADLCFLRRVKTEHGSIYKAMGGVDA